MSEVKSFQIVGEIDKPTGRMRFTKEIKALRQEEAVERLLCEMGSRHKAKRFQIKILKIQQKQN
ncbi:MAG: 50S ribosomal protein L18Ae [Candidatus Bathyarchaeia archaeon]